MGRYRTGVGSEQAFLERLRTRLPPAPEGQVWIGDDAAVLDGLLFATDALVEGVHFDLAWCSPADVGWKALAVNLSDLAAMGGTPRAAVAALAVPPGPPGLADQLIDGVIAAAAAFGCPLVGGDTTAGPAVMISVAVLGDCVPTGPVLRSGAAPGDAVFVTGELGGPAAAIEALRRGIVVEPALVQPLHRPAPRLREGTAAAAGNATAMIDISDGLAIDLGRLCNASGVGVRIEANAVPLAPGATFAHALLGDDYELCFTATDPDAMTRHFTRSGCSPPTRIGTITLGERVMVDAGGIEGPLPTAGWDHVVP